MEIASISSVRSSLCFCFEGKLVGVVREICNVVWKGQLYLFLHVNLHESHVCCGHVLSSEQRFTGCCLHVGYTLDSAIQES